LENKTEKKVKGVKKYVINNSIDQQDYKDDVENSKTKYRKMNVFRSIKHDMYTQLKNKVALSPKDDKRCTIKGAFKTLAWGHKHIEILEDKTKSDDSEVNDVCETLKNIIKSEYIT
jgi:hypothetical protein